MFSETLKLLENPRKDPAPFLGALRDFWGLDVAARDLSFSGEGAGGAHTIFFGGYVAKTLAAREPWAVAAFRREHKVLCGLTQAQDRRTTNASCADIFGVDEVASLVQPEPEHDLAMFVMPRLQGQTLWEVPDHAHENWLMEKLARFYIGFDRAMARQYPDEVAQNPYLSLMAMGEVPLPDHIADIGDLLEIARDELEKTKSLPPKHIYDDMNPGNILIDAQTHMPRIGIVDMGQTYFGNPHRGFSALLAQRLAVYGLEAAASSFHLINAVNELAGSEPWVDVKSCVTLMPIRVANFSAHFHNKAIPSYELDRIRRGVEGIKTLFDDFGIRPTLIQGHSLDGLQPVPKG